MTDAERIELDALELRCKAYALNESELDKLYYLRLRAAGVCTWQEVVDAIQASIPEEPASTVTTYPAWFHRHEQMLPSAGPDDGETE